MPACTISIAKAIHLFSYHTVSSSTQKSEFRPQIEHVNAPVSICIHTYLHSHTQWPKHMYFLGSVVEISAQTIHKTPVIGFTPTPSHHFCLWLLHFSRWPVNVGLLPHACAKVVRQRNQSRSWCFWTLDESCLGRASDQRQVKLQLCWSPNPSREYNKLWHFT